MKSIAKFFGAILFTATTAMADVPYVDDRSSAAALIKSLYNAVNRREYARAFDYFSTPPAQSFDAYVKGYEGTEHVEIATGTVTAEGAAGSIFHTVPVAIKSYNSDGSEKVFAGCYVVREVNAAIQDPPFRGLRIEGGKLKLSDASSVDGAVPDCGNAFQEEEQATVEEAIKTYLSVFEDICGLSSGIASGKDKPEAYDLSYKQPGSNELSTAQLFRFPCSRAAYNESHVYLLRSGIEPLQPLALAEPDLDIKYQGAEDNGEATAVIKSMSINGFTTGFEAVNSDFDPKTQRITTFSKWRGIGDASSNSAHRFTAGRFVLWNYQADPTYDEEINPYDVIVDGTVLPAPQLSEEAQ